MHPFSACLRALINVEEGRSLIIVMDSKSICFINLASTILMPAKYGSYIFNHHSSIPLPTKLICKINFHTAIIIIAFKNCDIVNAVIVKFLLTAQTNCNDLIG